MKVKKHGQNKKFKKFLNDEIYPFTKEKVKDYYFIFSLSSCSCKFSTTASSITNS